MKRLPLQIEQEIFIKPLAEKTPHKAKSRVIGARHGDFIIIEEPVIKISDHLVALVGISVSCWLFHEGTVYKFDTVVKGTLPERLTLLEYPSKVDIEQLRKFIRIQVNLEAEFRIRNAVYKGSVVDISEGGCQLHGDSIIIAAKNDAIKISFLLPDDQYVDNIEGIIRNIEYDRMRMKTRIGVQFKGPESELKKVVSFCQFCQYFKIRE